MTSERKKRFPFKCARRSAHEVGLVSCSAKTFKQPGVHSGDAAHRPRGMQSPCPWTEVEWADESVSLLPAPSAYGIFHNMRNTISGCVVTLRSSHGPDIRGGSS